jgi:hypothetical protein
MTDIRQIRSISNYSGGGKGSEGYSGGQPRDPNAGQNRWSKQDTYDATSLGGPIINPPISFHDIPVIQI